MKNNNVLVLEIEVSLLKDLEGNKQGNNTGKTKISAETLLSIIDFSNAETRAAMKILGLEDDDFFIRDQFSFRETDEEKQKFVDMRYTNYVSRFKKLATLLIKKKIELREKDKPKKKQDSRGGGEIAKESPVVVRPNTENIRFVEKSRSLSPITKEFEKTISFLNKNKNIFSLSSRMVNESGSNNISIGELETESFFKEEVEKFQKLSLKKQKFRMKLLEEEKLRMEKNKNLMNKLVRSPKKNPTNPKTVTQHRSSPNLKSSIPRIIDRAPDRIPDRLERGDRVERVDRIIDKHDDVSPKSKVKSSISSYDSEDESKDVFDSDLLPNLLGIKQGPILSVKYNSAKQEKVNFSPQREQKNLKEYFEMRKVKVKEALVARSNSEEERGQKLLEDIKTKISKSQEKHEKSMEEKIKKTKMKFTKESESFKRFNDHYRKKQEDRLSNIIEKLVKHSTRVQSNSELGLGKLYQLKKHMIGFSKKAEDNIGPIENSFDGKEKKKIDWSLKEQKAVEYLEKRRLEEMEEFEIEEEKKRIKEDNIRFIITRLERIKEGKNEKILERQREMTRKIKETKEQSELIRQLRTKLEMESKKAEENFVATNQKIMYKEERKPQNQEKNNKTKKKQFESLEAHNISQQEHLSEKLMKDSEKTLK